MSKNNNLTKEYSANEYLHALNSATIGWERGEVVGLTGDREGSGGLEASEWCNHGGLWGGSVKATHGGI